MSLSVLTPSGWSPMGGSTGWQRPADWLPLNVTPGEQKVKVLVAIGTGTPEPNRVMTVLARPSYTVDWGDGTAPENVNDNIIAKHVYDPSVLTATSEGWKQAVVTITPQASGTFTVINLTSPYYVAKTWSSPVVELVTGPSIGTVTIASAPQLHRVEFLTPMTGSAYTMSGCVSLREVIGKVRITGTSALSMFSGNYSQEVFPEIEFVGAVSNVSSMFLTCTAMKEPPYVNLSEATNMTSMFNGCSAMLEAPTWLDASTKCTNFTSLFSNCYKLERVPTLATPAGTVFAGMFQNCGNLQTVPWFDLSKATSVANMFSGCTSLISIGGSLDFGAVNVAPSGLFTTCNALRNLSFTKGPPMTFSLIGMLDAVQLDAIYTSLPTVSGQTITVTGIPGGLGDNPAIATAKGWTVTGS